METMKTLITLFYLTHAICEVESNHNATAHNAKEDAVGCMQIRPICVKEGQRLGIDFTLADRWDCSKSKTFFIQMQIVRGLSEPEEIARRWNGGGNGMRMESTRGYWRKVKAVMKRERREVKGMVGRVIISK
jgi:hypothetical protein